MEISQQSTIKIEPDSSDLDEVQATTLPVPMLSQTNESIGSHPCTGKKEFDSALLNFVGFVLFQCGVVGSFITVTQL